MTVIECASLVADDLQSLKPLPTPCPSAPEVLDTTELRWFVPEPLPHAIGDWFTGSTGVLEERCDTYLLGGRSNIGVKRRFGTMLELKLRHSLDGRSDLGAGLAGQLEVWRRWSPVECLVDHDADGRWVDVCKSIVKRRFQVDGTEVAFSSQVAGSGCDVEVVEVTVGAVRGWSFAFSAFGPRCSRRGALVASWHTLMTGPTCPDPFGARTGRAMGYPEWLALTANADSNVSAVRQYETV